jgi:hypothetical protein
MPGSLLPRRLTAARAGMLTMIRAEVPTVFTLAHMLKRHTRRAVWVRPDALMTLQLNASLLAYGSLVEDIVSRVRHERPLANIA